MTTPHDKVNTYQGNTEGVAGAGPAYQPSTSRAPTAEMRRASDVALSPRMDYNIVDELSRLQRTLPFLEVVKIPQPKENLLRAAVE